MRRLSLAILQLLSALFPLLPVPAFAFNDVDASVTNHEAIDALQKDGVLQGYSDGTFRADSTINRAEFLKILLEARGKVGDATNCFPDVHSEWFAKYVCTAKSEDIVSGYPDGTFRPEEAISFVEAAKILSLAYKQQGQAGSEWYEPYARALEMAKAIPPSIDSLDKKITRGDMAEMMWRVKDKVTDRESKGYLNVKYPSVTVNLSSDEPQKATTCADLAAFESENAQAGYNDGRMYKNMAVPEAADAGVRNTMAPSVASSMDHSETNVQVAGVDEADTSKTDGKYIYSIVQSGQSVRIVKALPATDLQETASITFAGGNFSPTDLYVHDGRLVVIGTSWKNMPNVYSPMVNSKMMIYPPMWNAGQAVARIYDVSTPSAPVLKRTVSFDGSLVSTRRIDDKLYLVVNQGMRYWGGPVPLANVREDDLLPAFTDSANGNVETPVADCGDITILPRVRSPQYLTVGVVDIDNDASEIKRSVILGRGDTVYSSLENLYIATQDWQYTWDPVTGDTGAQKTRLYRFALDGDGVTFAARGAVDGSLLNQFSMDEHEQTFRVATTTNNWYGDGKLRNNLFTLNRETLAVAGSLTDIAPGEQIYSVRFMGDRAYMVTFKTVDPLFVIDLADDRHPKILGQLKIPGYSTYLHPVDATHIIGFGKDVDESIDANLVHDPNAVYYTAVQGLKLALFDVSNVQSPKEVSHEIIGDSGSDSPLLYDHRALFFDAQRQLIAFPASVTKVTNNPNATGPWDKTIQQQIFQGAYVYHYDLGTGFTLSGKVTHYHPDDCDRTQPWNSCYGRDISRILRIGESLYTVSDGTVMSHQLPRLTQQDELRSSLENVPVAVPVPMMEDMMR